MNKNDGNKIEPTKVEPTKVESTKVEPTKIEPTKIESTKVEPTKIEPTKIEPTEIKPTEIKTTETTNTSTKKSNKPGFKYSHVASIIYFLFAILASIITLIMGINKGFTYPTIMSLIVTLFALIFFFTELKKMDVSQSKLDEWKKEILAKHPNYRQSYLDAMTEETYKNSLNRFSYWTHTFKLSFLKVLACIALPAIVLTAGAGAVVAVTGGSGTKVEGIYLEEHYANANSSNAEVVTTTAFYFDGDDTCKRGAYDLKTKKTQWMNTYSYTISGSTVKVQKLTNFTIKNAGKKLVASDGSVWVRVSK